MKILSHSEGNSAPEAVTWQRHRQALPAVPDPDWIIIYFPSFFVLHLLQIEYNYKQ